MLRDIGGIKGAGSLLLEKLSEEPNLRNEQMAAGYVPAEVQVPGDLCGTILWEEECC